MTTGQTTFPDRTSPKTSIGINQKGLLATWALLIRLANNKPKMKEDTGALAHIGISQSERKHRAIFPTSPMHTLLGRLLTLLLLLTVSASGASTFHSSQSRISFGDSCTLTWSTAASEAYIVGVGKVEGSGSVQVAPGVPTDFVLVVNTGGRIEYTKLHIDVDGLKGNEEYPDQDKFQPGLRDERKAPYLGFLDTVFKTLQGKFPYHVRGSYLPPDHFILIYTNWAVQPKLMLSTDKGIRQRKVAYAVHVNEGTSDVTAFDIRALVQYQRMGESEWRDDKDPQVNRMAEEMLQGGACQRL